MTTRTQALGPSIFRFTTNDYAAYLQDEWKIVHNLTLSLGLREEYQQLPNPNPALVNPDIPETHAPAASAPESCAALRLRVGRLRPGKHGAPRRLWVLLWAHRQLNRLCRADPDRRGGLAAQLLFQAGGCRARRRFRMSSPPSRRSRTSRMQSTSTRVPKSGGSGDGAVSRTATRPRTEISRRFSRQPGPQAA